MSNIEGLHEESPSSSDVHSAQSKQNTHNGGVPVFARAKHSFEGRNNDEVYNVICFEISILQFTD